MDPYQSILRKAPPADMEKNKAAFREAARHNPEALDVLVSKKHHPFPFTIMDLSEDDDAEKPFLHCRYNQQGESSFRSPWTNRVYQGGSGGGKSSKPDAVTASNSNTDENIRLLEGKLNHVWDAYKNLYYGSSGGDAVGSVYLEACDEKKGSFKGFLGIQKNIMTPTDGDDNKDGSKSTAAAAAASIGPSWSSMHLIQVGAPDPTTKTCSYKVESTCMMVALPEVRGTTTTTATTNGSSKPTTSMDISATLSKDVSKKCKVLMSTIQSSHIENIGTLVEANEIDMRSNLERVHVPKTQEIMDVIQKPVAEEKKYRPAVNPLMGMIMQSDVLKKKLAKESPTRG